MLATRVFCAAVPVLLCALLVPSALTKAQQTALSKGERDRNRQILNDAYDAVKEHYYDRNYHGVDLKALHSEYATKVEESESNGQAFRMIAAFLGKLNDSHTFFIPPLRPYSFDYGYRMQMIGDRCFVTAVRPGTDAEAKAHVGDQVLNLDGYSVNRTDFRALSYYLGELAPQPMSSLDLLTPGGQKEAVRITVKFEKKQEVIDAFGPWRWAKQVDGSRQVVVGDATFWKMPIFLANDSTVDHLFSSARQHKTLILDLRGNPGGAGGTLERMLGYVFDHDVKIGDRITRTEKEANGRQIAWRPCVFGKFDRAYRRTVGIRCRALCTRGPAGEERGSVGRSLFGDGHGSPDLSLYPGLSECRCLRYRGN